MISFQSEEVQIPSIIKPDVKDWIEKVIESHHFVPGELNYIFCSDDYILSINRQYLNHDYFTDIITFDYRVNNVISGDLIISLDTVKSNANKYGDNYEMELLRVIIHGILHLCGFNDKTSDESQLMRQLEDKALNLYSTFK